MGNARDLAILRLLNGREGLRFRELERTRMMAKSTLSKHLGGLCAKRLVKKKYSETLGCVVYVITPQGKQELKKTTGARKIGRMTNLEEYLS
jgi:DNA-binding MarR family transcriptional regulator